MSKGIKKVTPERVKAHQSFVEAHSAPIKTITTAYLFKGNKFEGTIEIDMGPYRDLQPTWAAVRAMEDSLLSRNEWDVFIPIPNHYVRTPIRISY